MTVPSLVRPVAGSSTGWATFSEANFAKIALLIAAGSVSPAAARVPMSTMLM